MPPSTCRKTTPAGLSRPSRAVCLIRGRMITGNGMNMADSRYTKDPRKNFRFQFRAMA
ncbi:hypothetical protein D3C85_1896610 [compost metagenome]